MSLLSVCQALAKNVGLAVPDQIVGSSHREWTEAREFATEAGQELARRVDWSALASSATLAGRGSDFGHPMPDDFDRLQRGVTIVSGGKIVRPLTRAEWNTLSMFEGAARYFLLENDTVRFWPYLASGVSATVRYQSAEWVVNGTGLSAELKQEFTADDDVSRIDENLLTMALIVRWRRQKGMPYEDFEAEYEAALRDYAGFDVRSRF